ncbi:hypothetical protein LTR22_025752 [Elasticomyces elasticus]|nr:hypothetical protein LTR22_025752 [Elasticomyces elasticus]
MASAPHLLQGVLLPKCEVMYFFPVDEGVRGNKTVVGDWHGIQGVTPLLYAERRGRYDVGVLMYFNGQRLVQVAREDVRNGDFNTHNTPFRFFRRWKAAYRGSSANAWAQMSLDHHRRFNVWHGSDHAVADAEETGELQANGAPVLRLRTAGANENVL